MSESDLPEGAVRCRGAEPSLIERFGIDGLYGYRSISFESDYMATILIAKNGSGKTTLLGALDAFLRMQLSRLRNLEFNTIRCKLRSEDAELVLSHNDVVEFLQVPKEGEIARLASRAGVEPAALFNYIVDEWNEQEEYRIHWNENKTYNALLSAFNYNHHSIVSAVEKARLELMERKPNVSAISATLQKALSGYEIVYLPTYRRVELTLRRRPSDSPSRRIRPKFDVATGSLFTGDIQFGLTDISERLSQMNQQIMVESNIGYRKISANIINELLDGSFDNEMISDSDRPEPEELKLFFERLEKGGRTGPYMPVSIPNLEKLYSNDHIPEQSSRFLRYFLAQLATVIRSTKDVESTVDGFINNCNKYLASAEPSTSFGNEALKQNLDGKVLKLNRSNLTLHVESIPENRKISLDALSSGEKQMISLFAKMFLYPKKKVVLIDEPELSLSIDWQKEILVDVLSAALCSQLIAITHSPFVFDNELEPFARGIKLERVAVQDVSDEEVDFEQGEPAESSDDE